MAELSPFAAIRYDQSRTGGDISSCIAPPYDVLDLSDKRALLQKNPDNIVGVDLPHVPPKSAGPAEVYEAAAQRLQDLLARGVLIRDQRPAIYLYHQQFEHDGQSYTRRMVIARLRLRPFADGVILPHEQTFGGPKEDRLALMKATRCNLSPIFGLYTDPDGAVAALLEPLAARAADATATLDGVQNRLWIVSDAEVITRLAATVQERKIFIADGHHRYTTALNYRDGLVSQNGAPLPPDHPANFCMFVLASMDDPGTLILAYNRALAGVDLDAVMEAWVAGIAPCDEEDADLRLYCGRTEQVVPVRFTRRDKLDNLAPGEVRAWRKLDVAYLHRYLLDELLTRKLGAAPAVRYVKSAEDARHTAREEHGVALLLNATPMAHLRAVSEAGGLMPQKSTYFHPKLATGMTINPLY